MVRILIADRYEIVRTGLQSLIGLHPAWKVVAVAADGRSAIEEASKTKPDIAVLGYELPLSNGIEVTRQIRAKTPKTEVLIFTAQEDEDVIFYLLQAGARGYVLKSDGNPQLLAAIEALASHRPYFTGKISEMLVQSFTNQNRNMGSADLPGRPILTPRERQVVQLIAEGYSGKGIAKRFNISSRTVETHRSAVLRKLKVQSSRQLVRYAIRNRMIQP
jgi:DNA-binding NarL/FixJ family response regulator